MHNKMDYSLLIELKSKLILGGRQNYTVQPQENTTTALNEKPIKLDEPTSGGFPQRCSICSRNHRKNTAPGLRQVYKS